MIINWQWAEILQFPAVDHCIKFQWKRKYLANKDPYSKVFQKEQKSCNNFTNEKQTHNMNVNTFAGGKIKTTLINKSFKKKLMNDIF